MMQRDGIFGMNTWMFILLALVMGSVILFLVRGTVRRVIQGVVG